MPCKYVHVGVHGLVNLLNFKTTQYACVQICISRKQREIRWGHPKAAAKLSCSWLTLGGSNLFFFATMGLENTHLTLLAFFLALKAVSGLNRCLLVEDPDYCMCIKKWL